MRTLLPTDDGTMMKFILIVFSFWSAGAASQRFMYFKKCDIPYNPKFLKNVTCSVNQVGSLVELNVESYIIVDIHNLFVDMELSYNVNDKYNGTVFKQNFFLCKIVSSKNVFSLHYFAQKIYSMIQKYSNMITCIHKVDFLRNKLFLTIIFEYF